MKCSHFWRKKKRTWSVTFLNFQYLSLIYFKMNDYHKYIRMIVNVITKTFICAYSMLK